MTNKIMEAVRINRAFDYLKKKKPQEYIKINLPKGIYFYHGNDCIGTIKKGGYHA